MHHCGRTNHLLWENPNSIIIFINFLGMYLWFLSKRQLSRLYGYLFTERSLRYVIQRECEENMCAHHRFTNRKEYFRTLFFDRDRSRDTQLAEKTTTFLLFEGTEPIWPFMAYLNSRKPFVRNKNLVLRILNKYLSTTASKTVKKKFF